MQGLFLSSMVVSCFSRKGLLLWCLKQARRRRTRRRAKLTNPLVLRSLHPQHGLGEDPEEDMYASYLSGA